MKTQTQEHEKVPIGSQVVVTDPLNQYNGKYGVVIENPYVDKPLADNEYLVRFVDRNEVVVQRNKFRYRKGLQNEGFRRATEDGYIDDTLVYKCIVGSHAYGLATESSDLDIRGIYLAKAEDQWSIYGCPEQIETTKPQDQTFWEIGKFINLALKANPNILEVLSSPEVLYCHPIANKLVENRSKFLSKLVYHTYMGYTVSQYGKMQQDLRNGNKIRFKHCMHLIRLLLSGIYILKNHDALVDVGEHKEWLLDIRNEKYTFDEVDRWKVELQSRFEDEFKKSSLPEKPDFSFANRYLVECRVERAKEYINGFSTENCAKD